MCAYEHYHASLINKNQEYTHKDCVHYQNGFCKLNLIKVDPDGSVCPGFTLRNTQEKKEELPVNPGVSKYRVPNLPASNRGYRIGKRRRGRRGRK